MSDRDPTIAERSRRYRERRADRSGVAFDRSGDRSATVGNGVEIVKLLRAVLSTLTELVELNRRLINSVENRSGARSATRYGPDRSATVDEGARLGADAPARMGARLSGPSGPREPLVADNGVARSGTATASEPLDHWEPVSAEIVELVLGSLNGSQSSSTIDAIADHRDLSRSAVAAALRELVLARRVVRLPPASSAPGDAERWQLAAAVESPTETIACTAYREHAIAGHRRDPATGRFRCYLCEPDPPGIELVAGFVPGHI